MRTLLTILLTLMFSVFAFAQSILTNEDVIEMAKTGLSADIIVAKIKASETKFDTSTTALVKLTDAKVPDAVVVAMLEKEKNSQEKTLATQKENNDSKDSIPEQGKLSDIVGKKRVYILTKFIKARDLIAKELEKEKTFTLVERVEDSDFVIGYDEANVEIGATGGVYGNTATVRKLDELVGVLTVMMPSSDENSNRVRLIYSTKKSKYYVWENNPAQSTTKQFLKDLKKASDK